MKKPIHLAVQSAREFVNWQAQCLKDAKIYHRRDASTRAKGLPGPEKSPHVDSAHLFATTLVCAALAHLRGRLHMKEYGRYGANGWYGGVVVFASLADQETFIRKGLENYRMRGAVKAREVILGLLELREERLQARAGAESLMAVQSVA